MKHLSGLDATFLHLETPEMPMHVGSLNVLDLPKGYKGDFYEDAKSFMASRIHLADVFTRKLALMPFDMSNPVWVEDDDIDLDYHVRHVTLRKPGTMHQLEQLVARLHSSLLDRSRPLWEMVVIEGLHDGQVAFYTKAHHSGVDGAAGVELAKVLYDMTPEIREVPPPRRKRDGGGSYQLGVAELLQAAAENSLRQYRKIAELVPTAVKAIATAGGVLATQRDRHLRDYQRAHRCGFQSAYRTRHRRDSRWPDRCGPQPSRRRTTSRTGGTARSNGDRRDQQSRR